MKKCWELLGLAYPKLQCCGCWAHILNLLLKDIASNPLVKAVLDSGRDIVNAFSRQQINNSLLQGQQRLHKVTRGLSRDGDTRFSSRFTMLQSLVLNRAPLASTVLLESFDDSSARMSVLKDTVLDSAFWNKAVFLCKMFEPVAEAITRVQSDECSQGDAYFIMAALQHSIDELVDDAPFALSPMYSEFKHLVKARYDFGFTPAMTLAALLHPLYQQLPPSKQPPQDERLKAEVLCGTLGSKAPKRVGNDILPDATGLTARKQLNQFMGQRYSSLGMERGSLSPALATDPLSWWTQYGNGCKELQDVALRIFSLPASSAAGERFFSSLKNVWSDKRNRLLAGRAAMLAFIFFNTKVLARAGGRMATAGDWEDFLAEIEDLGEIEGGGEVVVVGDEEEELDTVDEATPI